MKKKLTGFIITAGHLDIEWYQPLRSYRFWTVQALTDLKEAAKREDFKCYVLDGQVYPLLEHLSVVPEDEAEMRRLIAQGKLKIGPFYTQFDEWLPSAENMIRNCLYGKRDAGKFGGYMRAGYLPDNFGHPMQMPQILNGFGIDSLLFMRGMPEVKGGHPDEFIYEGPDGSKVLGIYFRESYSGAFDIFNKPIDPIQPREAPYYPDYLSFEYHRELAVHDDPQRIAQNMIANAHRIADRFPSGVIPLISGYDHLPPQINIGDSVRAANEMQDEIEFVMGDVEEYIRTVQRSTDDFTKYNMELVGSQYQYVLLGALSTRTYLKRQNFACEAMLEKYAEPLTAIARMHGYRDHEILLNEAWTNLLVNSAHDSIHGSSVDEVHVEMESRFAQTRQIASGVMHEAMAHLAGQMRLPEGKSALVYTPPGTKNAQPAEVWLAIGDRDISMANKDGEILPTQILPRESVELNGIGKPRNDMFPKSVYRKVLFMTDGTQDISAYTAVSDVPKAPEALLQGDDTYMENEFLRVDVRGALIDIADKRTGKTWHGLNLLEEDADAGDAWDFSPPWIPGAIVRSSSFDFTSRLTENGPVRMTIAIEGNMLVPKCLHGDERSRERSEMPVRFEISMYRDLARVDVKLRFENNARDHRVRLKLNMGVRTDKILSQGHLAVLSRDIERQKEIERWRQPPTQLLPCREWIAAADKDCGLAVAMKGLYDYEAAIDPLRATPDVGVTLLRGFQMMGRRHTIMRDGGASEAFVTPGAQCLGEQVIEWSFLPYGVDEQDIAPFIGDANSFLYPPLTHAARTAGNADGAESIPCPVQWSANNVQFSAFKRAEDGDGYILRLFENQGKSTDCTVRLRGFASAVLSNMDETAIENMQIANDALELHFAPYKAVTLRLR